MSCIPAVSVFPMASPPEVTGSMLQTEAIRSNATEDMAKRTWCFDKVLHKFEDAGKH
jgi:hypothetical protein